MVELAPIGPLEVHHVQRRYVLIGSSSEDQKATERVLSSPPNWSGDGTPTTVTETMFWGIIFGVDPTGIHYQFLRVLRTFEANSWADFRMTNGMAYRLLDAGSSREVGIARGVNGNKAVANYTVAMMTFAGYDIDGEPPFLFQFAFDPSKVITPIHDHRDNLNGGFAFSCYHPGTGLPQPWAQ